MAQSLIAPLRDIQCDGYKLGLLRCTQQIDRVNELEGMDVHYNSNADNTNNFSDGNSFQRPMSMDDQFLLNSHDYDSENHHDQQSVSPDNNRSSSKGSIISKMVRRSMDDSGVSDLRMSRLAQAEAAMRQEIFKCPEYIMLH